MGRPSRASSHIADIFPEQAQPKLNHRPIFHDPGVPAHLHPGKPQPIFGVIVDDDGDSRILLDVADSLEVIDFDALGLGVQGRIQALAVERLDDGDNVRLAVRIDCRQPRHPVLVDKRALPLVHCKRLREHCLAQSVLHLSWDRMLRQRVLPDTVRLAPQNDAAETAVLPEEVSSALKAPLCEEGFVLALGPQAQIGHRP
jgi:hypothetical protein